METEQQLAMDQIEWARQYVLELVEDIPQSRWFEIPPGSVSCVGWQLGHLAFAEYGLCLFQQRGRQPIDSELMTGRFRKTFARGSTPPEDATAYPSPEEIQTTLERMHAQALQEIPTFTTEELQQPLGKPWAAYPNRLGALLFCSHHEMLHAGQIGLLRRELGFVPRG
jgi:uncharacterized damage-inducible protein DinB